MRKLSADHGKRPTTLAGELLEGAIVRGVQDGKDALLEEQPRGGKAPDDDAGTRELLHGALKELVRLRKEHRNGVVQLLWLVWGKGRTEEPVGKREINEWAARWLGGK